MTGGGSREVTPENLREFACVRSGGGPSESNYDPHGLILLTACADEWQASEERVDALTAALRGILDWEGDHAEYLGQCAIDLAKWPCPFERARRLLSESVGEGLMADDAYEGCGCGSEQIGWISPDRSGFTVGRVRDFIPSDGADPRRDGVL